MAKMSRVGAEKEKCPMSKPRAVKRQVSRQNKKNRRRKGGIYEKEKLQMTKKKTSFGQNQNWKWGQANRA